jgi:hypothetical protein
MIEFFLPGFNRYIVIGILLFVIGLFLSVFIIGIPIMAAGWFLATFGVFYYFFKFIPGHEKVEAKVKEYLKQWFGWYRKLFQEVFKK